ncbi:MAG: DUF4197 domain-containing protein [Pseudomonadota bacterium]
MPTKMILVITLFVMMTPFSYANQLEDLAKDLLGKSTEKSEETTTESSTSGSESADDSSPHVVSGLKAALSQGVDIAIKTLGREDGFFTNELVKIPLPGSLDKVKKGLGALGQEKLADDFILTMNRAAESAVPETASILAEAIKGMSVEDALEILKGDDNAATEYFRKVGESDLLEKLSPIVKTAMDDNGVTSAYKALMKQTGPLGGFLGQESTDIDQYVTQQSLNGLFTVIAEEEKRIRSDPIARTTDLLKQVFGQ